MATPVDVEPKRSWQDSAFEWAHTFLPFGTVGYMVYKDSVAIWLVGPLAFGFSALMTKRAAIADLRAMLETSKDMLNLKKSKAPKLPGMDS